MRVISATFITTLRKWKSLNFLYQFSFVAFERHAGGLAGPFDHNTGPQVPVEAWNKLVSAFLRAHGRYGVLVSNVPQSSASAGAARSGRGVSCSVSPSHSLCTPHVVNSSRDPLLRFLAPVLCELKLITRSLGRVIPWSFLQIFRAERSRPNPTQRRCGPDFQHRFSP